MTSDPWIWSQVPEADRVPRVRREILAQGYSVVRADVPELFPEEAARSPWIFAERLLGARPALVERQPIKAVPGGRSFASSDAPAPLHTDSQMFAGAPPRVQVMACVRPATRGGESVLADTLPLLDRIQAADPELYRLLFEAPRRIPFVFGDVFGPTVAARGGSVAFTHAPVPLLADPIAVRLAPWIDAAPRIAISLHARDILVADNHRMLHGRNGFSGGAREFVRLLVWTTLDTPLSRHHVHATGFASMHDYALREIPEPVRRRLGLGARPETSRALAAVLEMLRGTPPGVIAAREGIAEPDLYRMRDAALAAAESALASELPAGDGEVMEALARIFRDSRRW